MSNSAKHSLHTLQAVSFPNADLSIYSEVYVGRGSRTSVLMEPIRDTRELPRFYSTVTETIEMCVAVLEIIIAQGCRL